jgi:hypothetical protein
MITDGDELVYDVYFGREPRLDEKDLLIRGTHETMVDVSLLKRLDYSTKYYWKVVAKDSYGGESTSYTESFTTQMRQIFLQLRRKTQEAELAISMLEGGASHGRPHFLSSTIPNHFISMSILRKVSRGIPSSEPRFNGYSYSFS